MATPSTPFPSEPLSLPTASAATTSSSGSASTPLPAAATSLSTNGGNVSSSSSSRPSVSFIEAPLLPVAPQLDVTTHAHYPRFIYLVHLYRQTHLCISFDKC
jgi:hypothetical protein